MKISGYTVVKHCAVFKTLSPSTTLRWGIGKYVTLLLPDQRFVIYFYGQFFVCVFLLEQGWCKCGGVFWVWY